MEVFIDAATAASCVKISQTEILSVNPDKIRKTVNIIHYSSSKNKAGPESALRAKLFVSIYGDDIGYIIGHILQDMLLSNNCLTI